VGLTPRATPRPTSRPASRRTPSPHVVIIGGFLTEHVSWRAIFYLSAEEVRQLAAGRLDVSLARALVEERFEEEAKVRRGAEIGKAIARYETIFAKALSRGELSAAILAVRPGERRIDEHREWMLHAFAIGLSVATMRLLFIPALMITGNPTDDQIALLSVGSFTVAFLLHAAAAEWWIRRTRPPTRGHADDRSLWTVSAAPNPVPFRQGANTAARSGQQS